MKMNNKYLAIIMLCVALLSPFACSKSFLETTNTFQSTADATFQKSSDVVSLINSIYDTYQNSDLLKKSFGIMPISKPMTGLTGVEMCNGINIRFHRLLVSCLLYGIMRISELSGRILHLRL